MRLLLLAGTHGVEPQSSAFLSDLITGTVLRDSSLDEKGIGIFSVSKLLGLNTQPFEDGASQISDLELNLQDFKNFRIIAIPVFNPYGLKNFTRQNHHGVDLNRNMPSQNWQSAKLKIDGEKNPYYPGDFPASELEVQVLTKLIENLDFDLIISFHTNHFVRYPNSPQINYDGHGKYRDFAITLAETTELEFTEDIGYPTPGSLGSYAKDRQLDCITVEFDDNIKAEELNKKYLETFAQSILPLFTEKDSELNTRP